MSLDELKIHLRNTLFGPTEPGHCVKCKQLFSVDNVYTEAGWRETKISQLCERCWNDMFKMIEESED